MRRSAQLRLRARSDESEGRVDGPLQNDTLGLACIRRARVERSSPGIVDGDARPKVPTQITRNGKEEICGSAQCSQSKKCSGTPSAVFAAGHDATEQTEIQNLQRVFPTPATEPWWHGREAAIRFSQRRRLPGPRPRNQGHVFERKRENKTLSHGEERRRIETQRKSVEIMAMAPGGTAGGPEPAEVARVEAAAAMGVPRACLI
jgi:hypothetical protein